MLERAKARTPDRAQLRAGAQYGGFALKDDEAPLSVELEREAALSKKISALEVRRDARSEIWQVLARVVDNREAFLRSAKQPLREHTPIEPKLQRGETPAAAIVRLRDRPNELRAELAAITSRSATLEIAKARLRDEINRLAACAPDVSALLRPDGGSIAWPETRQQCPVFVRLPPPTGEHSPRVIHEAGDGFAAIT